MEPAATLDSLALLARQAGAAVMAVYASDFDVSRKTDASPVTEADLRAEAIIVAGLQALAPHIPIVAEEAMAAGAAPQLATRFWLVDPLDGTREFVSRNGEFTVNIALVEAVAPLAGVVFAPALGRLYAGWVGQGAFVEEAGVRQAMACRKPASEGLVVVASRSHGDEAALQAYLAGKAVADVVYAGSSLKLCLIANAQADLYPRFGRTMEWDIAAGHAVLAAAGGSVQTLDGMPLRYGKPGFENPHFVAQGAR
jgi:3'(2'), 5'-bisphosphate nucleotidase